MQASVVKGYWLALLGVFIVSPDALLIRLIGDDPLLINAWRGLISGSLVLVISHFLEPRNIWQQVRPAGWWAMLVVLANAIAQFAFVFAISHANVTNALVIIAFAPLVSAFLSAVFLRENVLLRTWVATLVCGIGLALLLYQPESRSQWSGLVSAFVCALALAVQFVVMRGQPQANLSACVGAGNLLAGVVCVMLVGSMALTSEQWLPVMLMAVLVSPLPFLLFVMALRSITAAETSLILLLESILGSLWVWLWLGEQPSQQTLFAGGLVITTLAVYGWLSLRGVERG